MFLLLKILITRKFDLQSRLNLLLRTFQHTKKMIYTVPLYLYDRDKNLDISVRIPFMTGKYLDISITILYMTGGCLNISVMTNLHVF